MNELVPIEDLEVTAELAERYHVPVRDLIGTFGAVCMPANYTRGELISCLTVAREHQLNPLLKEIYFMRDNKFQKIQPFVGIDGWVSKMNTHPQFDGVKFKEVQDGEDIGVRCRIWRKDRKRPIEITEWLSECKQKRSKPGPWDTHPKRMLRHRALNQCVRIAFGFAGVMDPQEFSDWQESADDNALPVTTIEPIDLPPDVPDVPDIPLEPEEEPEYLADQNGLIERIREDLSACEDITEARGVILSNTTLTRRCSPANRQKIADFYRTELGL